MTEWCAFDNAARAAAEIDHDPVGVSDFADDIYDNCAVCGLAVFLAPDGSLTHLEPLEER